jgi:hemolysin activation/secretion protein
MAAMMQVHLMALLDTRFRTGGATLPVWHLVLGSCLLATSGGLSAQTVAPAQVDPAALQRQEALRVMREQRPPVAAQGPAVVIRQEPQDAPPVVAMGAGVRFLLQDIRFGPSTFLKPEELRSVAAHFVGKELEFTDLTKIVAEVNALYRAHGISTANANLPQQRIQGGVVVIDLLEARVGQVEVLGSQYTLPSYVSSWFESELGKPLDSAQLEDRIKRFNRSSNIQMGANLRPGASFGLTDVLLELREPARFEFRAFANNEGSRSVGREQVGVDLTLNGPAGIGDKMSLYASHSRGTTSGALSYSVPVNRRGGRLSASFNRGVTDVVAGAYAELDITGGSKSVQLAVVQPIWQSGNWWFDVAGSVGQTRSRNEIGGLNLSDTYIQNETLGGTLSGSSDERSTTFGFTATHANATAGGAPSRSFVVAQINTTWVENIDPSSFALIRGALQSTGDLSLSPSLLFQVGGVASARGYDEGALSGDSGYVLNLELHRKLTEQVGGYVFVDVGGVKTKGLHSQSAHSWGAGFDMQASKALSGNITVGHSLKQVQPNQSRWRVTARTAYAF